MSSLALHKAPWRTLPLFLAAVCALLSSCSNIESHRILQLLNQEGFGNRASGVAVIENYVAGGDGIVFVIDPAVLQSPGAESLVFLTQVQQVGLDGTILVPYVGRLYVLGLTERELEALVKERLQALYKFDLTLTARIVDFGKAIYAYGEVNRKGRVPLPKGDITLIEAVFILVPTNLANYGRIKLIRPDAKNPLVVKVNMRQMLETGNTTYNLRIRENDIIYVPPTWIGAVARLVQKLVEPVGVLVQTLFGAAQIRYSYDILRGEEDAAFFRF